MPNIKDVAKEAGVSVATVSYVLNNKTTLVSAETRQHVLKAIQRVGYTPSIAGRSLQSSKTRLIGYAWHPITSGQVNPVLDQFTYFMAHAAEESGYHILTFTCPTENPVPVYAELIRSQRVDAFILSGTMLNDPRIEYLLSEAFPFVAFGRSNPAWNFSYVDTDAETGVEQAVCYLADLGHERIAFAGWPQDSLTGNYRLQGYLKGMRAAGLSVPSAYVVHGEQYESFGRDALRTWLMLPIHERPTAVMAVTDLIALGVMREARAQGLHIPGDLSVIGYDNAPLVEYFTPALTTLEQPIPDIGRTLVAMIETMFSGQPDQRVQMLVAPRFIVRDSCAPPR